MIASETSEHAFPEGLRLLVDEAVASVLPPEQRPRTPRDPLFGGAGALDSVGLVALIVAIEQLVEQSLGAIVVLADEKAMSQRNSPFRSIGAIVDHLGARLKEARNA
jgi:hypothetical protein